MSSKLPVITDARVERYMLDLTDATGHRGLPAEFMPTLLEMEALAERTHFPTVGPLVGRTLCMNAGLIGARRIVDLGCGFGYSSMWLAAAAGAGAKVICVDTNADNIERAKAFHARAGLHVDFEYRCTDALDFLELDPGPFDVVVCDVEKELYPRVGRLATERLRPGGLYMAASALWYGKVCVYGTTWDAWTSSVHQHNDWLFSQPNLFSQIVDQGDGLLVTVRRS
ncbi:MAG: methyltransferase domain-containing protein [Deltaproteobacteria bacterium]|nr:methyltransferase domain-containing protein [Deltaproteobacteria bacterium]